MVLRYAFLFLFLKFFMISNLIEIVKTLGDLVNNSCSNLKIVEIPEDVEYTIKAFIEIKRKIDNNLYPDEIKEYNS